MRLQCCFSVWQHWSIPSVVERGGTGQSNRQVPRWYLLRDLPVSHGNLSCD